MEGYKIEQNAGFTAEEIAAFVGEIFDEFIAPEYTEDGAAEFRKYIDPGAIAERLANNHFINVALDEDGRLAGLIEMRNNDHLSMLFVRNDMQRRGIGRALFAGAIEECLKNKPELEKVTVNSSPNSLGAYQRMGFEALSEEKEVNGLRFIPMVLELGRSSDNSA